MNLSNASRSLLSAIPGLNKAIDVIIARANTVFGAQHDNETGTHHDVTITAGGLSVVGDVVVTAVQGGATGAGTFDGNVIADADQDPVEIGRSLGTSTGTEGAVGHGVSVRSTPTMGFGFDWISTTGSAGTEVRLQFRQGDNVNPLRIRREAAGPTYHVMPGPVTNGVEPCSLGSLTDSFGLGRWTGIYGFDIDALTGFKERSRTAYVGEWTTFTPTRTASAGTWTVGTVTTAAYMLVGKTMTVSVYITGTSVSNAAVTLRIAIPGGFTAAKSMANPSITRQASGVYTTGNWDVQAAGTVITFYNAPGYATYGIDVTGTDVIAVATFEVQ